MSLPVLSVTRVVLAGCVVASCVLVAYVRECTVALHCVHNALTVTRADTVEYQIRNALLTSVAHA